MQFMCLIYSNPAELPKPGTEEFGPFHQIQREESSIRQYVYLHCFQRMFESLNDAVQMLYLTRFDQIRNFLVMCARS